MRSDNSILFHEEQRFRRLWLMVLLLMGMLLPIGILIFSTMKEQLNEMELVLSLIAITIFEIPIFIFFLPHQI